MSTAQTGNQHAIDYLAADDTGQFGWQGLSGFAIRASAACQIALMSLGGGVLNHGVFVEY
jgi:hypothetical protein